MRLEIKYSKEIEARLATLVEMRAEAERLLISGLPPEFNASSIPSLIQQDKSFLQITAEILRLKTIAIPVRYTLIKD